MTSSMTQSRDPSWLPSKPNVVAHPDFDPYDGDQHDQQFFEEN